jgi:hypothetical protein
MEKIHLYFLGQDNSKINTLIPICSQALPVEQAVKESNETIKTTLEKQLYIRTYYFGDRPYYNALIHSHLQLDSISIENKVANVYFTGSLEAKNSCDFQGIKAQLSASVLQFPEIRSVILFVNNKNIDTYSL